MLRRVTELEAKAESTLTHITSDIFEHVRLERHVHVDGSNDQTKLPFDNVQYSRDKLRGSFSK